VRDLSPSTDEATVEDDSLDFSALDTDFDDE